MRRFLALAFALLALTGAASASERATFANPLLPSGADPWVAQRNGMYYYLDTRGDRIAITPTRDLAKLAEAAPVVVWRAPAQGPNSISIWAPELHFLAGKWYLYYSAADREHDDDAHRGVFVLENDDADPTQGQWHDKGALNIARPGIDGTVFEWRARLYFVYSAYVDDHSDLILAPMRNPWTLEERQIDIARPTFAWEMQGGRKILEAPEFLRGPRGQLFLTYSASACWSDDYALGLLRADPGSDLTDPRSWRKAPRPVFASANGVYATGHNGFFKSPDGREDWLIYHANGGPGWQCTPRRAPRMQRFRWRADGTPDFGAPHKDGAQIAAPAR